MKYYALKNPNHRFKIIYPQFIYKEANFLLIFLTKYPYTLWRIIWHLSFPNKSLQALGDFVWEEF